MSFVFLLVWFPIFCMDLKGPIRNFRWVEIRNSKLKYVRKLTKEFILDNIGFFTYRGSKLDFLTYKHG
jgi:hypothetical protein